MSFLSSIRKHQKRWQRALFRGKLPEKKIPRWIYMPIRAIVLGFKQFRRHKGAFVASHLTFYSLLSFVPILAIVFAISRGFGVEESLEHLIYSYFIEQKQAAKLLLQFVHNILQETRSYIIAGGGIFFLLWSAYRVLSQIESAMNRIWQCSSRSFGRKFSEYGCFLLVIPPLFISANSVRIFLITKGGFIIGWKSLLSAVTSFSIISVVFTSFYLWMPNTKVPKLPACFAGVFSGALYQSVQWVYVFFQIGASRYNAIYGSFAALPLFLIWLVISWRIALLGAECAYGLQVVLETKGGSAMLIPGKTSHQLSIRGKKALLLWMVYRAAKKQQKGAPITKKELMQPIHVEHRFIEPLVEQLIAAHILCPIIMQKVTYYVVWENVLNQPLKKWIHRLDPKGMLLPIVDDPRFSQIVSYLEKQQEDTATLQEL